MKWKFTDISVSCNHIMSAEVSYKESRNLNPNHRIRRYTEGTVSDTTCCPIFMQNSCSIWPEGGAASQYSVFIGRSAD